MEPLRTFGSEDPSWNYVMLPNSDASPSPLIGKARVNFPAEMLQDDSDNFYRPSLMARRNRSMSAWSEMSSSWKLDESNMDVKIPSLELLSEFY
ncbi:hypothetical protein HUJ04_003644 [Dendroctonus ponderosae]|nr:hypothetical protein HUJ04_003644 [Dendroctonus ponderosae]KAH1010327.1 hypothetical protein HUJ05_004636 [Dendroctonus ponderosae]